MSTLDKISHWAWIVMALSLWASALFSGRIEIIAFVAIGYYARDAMENLANPNTNP
jgi:hypothetical protein